mgnify:FL=1|tara:strand:- start:168 stop:623 length:456 start_codon:yes stop_codon:yes gene_type:complete
MKRFSLLVSLIVITFFLTPIALFATAADLTPSQYAFGKQWASDFCEARDDGLTVESSFNVALKANATNISTYNMFIDLFNEINEEGVSASDQEKADEILEGEFSFSKIPKFGKFVLYRYGGDVMEFTTAKIQKNCPLTSKELAQYDQYLAE